MLRQPTFAADSEPMSKRNLSPFPNSTRKQVAAYDLRGSGRPLPQATTRISSAPSFSVPGKYVPSPSFVCPKPAFRGPASAITVRRTTTDTTDNVSVFSLFKGKHSVGWKLARSRHDHLE